MTYSGSVGPLESGDSSTDILFELYHENSKQRRHDYSFAQRIYLLNQSPTFHEIASRTFKQYPGSVVTHLPSVRGRHGPSLESVVARRRSVRKFDGNPLTLEDVGALMYQAHGITGSLDSGGGVRQPLRAAPSAGALFAVEVYFIASQVAGLGPGLYHYTPDGHSLETVRSGVLMPILAEASADPDAFGSAPAAFLLTAVLPRLHFKYGDRAYRFALLEAGHVCQNLLLAAVARDLAGLPVGGFIDEEIHAVLDVDGVEEVALYLVAVGRAAQQDASGAGVGRALAERLLSDLEHRAARGNDGVLEE